MTPKGTGIWTGVDGKNHEIPLHNTWTTAAWFSSALTVAEWIADPELTVSDVGPEQRDGIAVEHLHSFRTPAGFMDSGTASIIAAASQMDLYLDSTSSLPVALEFNAHPDTNEGINLPVRIEWGDYRLTAGFQVAYHVQKYLNNTLLLDISLASVNLNAPPLSSSGAPQQ